MGSQLLLYGYENGVCYTWLAKESPYDGAKPQFVVPQDKIDDNAWLNELLAGTVKQLPGGK